MQSPKFNTKIFRILQLVTIGALILGIIGVTSSGTLNPATFTPSTVSKVGIILYIAVLAAIAIIFIQSLPNVSAVPRSERIMRVHIPIALLAIAIRLAYSALCIFVNNGTFSLFGGSIVADIVMAIVEEFFVVVITLALGFKLRRISPSMESEVMNHNQNGKNHGRQLPGSEEGNYLQMSNSESEIFPSA
jgi:hypothetical protein